MGVVDIGETTADDIKTNRNKPSKNRDSEGQSHASGKSMSSPTSAVAATLSKLALPVEMFRKTTILAMRNRRAITISIYAIVLCLLAVLVYDPTMLDVLFPFLGLTAAAEDDGQTDSATDQQRSASDGLGKPPAKVPSVKRLLDLPFVPRDFLCDEMHSMAGRNFTYPEGYMDHADAYKSALQLNDLLNEAASNEQSWILQEIAQLPFVRTACETGFNAGHNAFHMLTANYDLVVYSFENLRRYNYTLEMTDFMIIEFPDRFYVFDGEPRQALAKFIIDQANQTTCDVMLVDSSQPREVVRDYFRQFRSIATKRDNLVVMNAHPSNVVKTPHGAEAEWEAMKQNGEIVEHFRCHHQIRDLSANQMGLLVGSFVF